MASHKKSKSMHALRGAAPPAHRTLHALSSVCTVVELPPEDLDSP